MRRLLILLIMAVTFGVVYCEEYFVITDYDVNMFVNKNGCIDVKEKIKVKFSEARHGIFRTIPYVYDIEKDKNGESGNLPVMAGSEYKTHLYNIRTPGENSEIIKGDKDIIIKIGDADKLVDGEKVYDIEYSIFGAAEKFKDHWEIYWNIIGTGWDTTIEKGHFQVFLPENVALSYKDYFVVTGRYGEKGKNINYKFEGANLSGETPLELSPHEGVTIGMKLPADYFKEDAGMKFRLFWINNGFTVLGILLVLGTTIGAVITWLRIGKDDKTPLVVQFEPPKGMTSAEAGVLIDDKIDNRDLTSLIYYWAGKGIIEIEEVEGAIFGIGKDFILRKTGELPREARNFEITMFNGLFYTKDFVKLSELKNTFYNTMDKVRDQLNTYMSANDYYVKWSRETGVAFVTAGGILFFAAFFVTVFTSFFFTLSMIVSGIVLGIFGAIMPKKSMTGNEKYFILKGFKEFIERAEKPKIEMLMKEDPAYFDKTLAFAVALGVGDKWAVKFEGLLTEPPRWYRSHYYHGGVFSTAALSRSINDGVNTMSSAMYSRPESKSGSSGFSGGGSSGGGFGGGGGGSW